MVDTPLYPRVLKRSSRKTPMRRSACGELLAFHLKWIIPTRVGCFALYVCSAYGNLQCYIPSNSDGRPPRSQESIFPTHTFARRTGLIRRSLRTSFSLSLTTGPSENAFSRSLRRRRRSPFPPHFRSEHNLPCYTASDFLALQPRHRQRWA